MRSGASSKFGACDAGGSDGMFRKLHKKHTVLNKFTKILLDAGPFM